MCRCWIKIQIDQFHIIMTNNNQNSEFLKTIKNWWMFKNRYLAVTQPLIYTRRRRSKRLAGGMIVAVWMMAAAITSPPLLGWFPRAKNQDFTQCSYNMDSSYVIFSSMGSFFLPMLVMLYVYFRISCVIARRHQDLESTTISISRRRNVLVS